MLSVFTSALGASGSAFTSFTSTGDVFVCTDSASRVVFNSEASAFAFVLNVANSVAGASLSTTAFFTSTIGDLASALSISIAVPVVSASTDETSTSCANEFAAALGALKLGNSVPCSSASAFCPSLAISVSTSISCCTLLGDSFTLGSISMHSSASTATAPCSSSLFSNCTPASGSSTWSTNSLSSSCNNAVPSAVPLVMGDAMKTSPSSLCPSFKVVSMAEMSLSFSSEVSSLADSARGPITCLSRAARSLALCSISFFSV